MIFIDVHQGKSGGWYADLLNGDGERWTLAGPGKQNAVVSIAIKFAEFSGFNIYHNGERFDGLKPSLMKGNAE